MNIRRRSFLSFLIGGAAGTALTPLPWKLTDDLSIWTQMWPWTPVPEDGRADYVNSVCTLCPGGCGITVRKINDRAVKIEGMAGHPVNNGGICILGASGLQLLYGPRRVKSPMKRVGERGAGHWEPISWDAAIAEAAARLGEVRAVAPQALGCFVGPEHGTVPALFQRFATAFGSPNFLTDTSIADSYRLTLGLMHGRDAIAGFDVENADFVLSFGAGALEGWGSPVRMIRAHSGWNDRGAVFVQVEHRLSATAAKADKWIAIHPGTEALLALALAHVIIKENLHSKEFVDGFGAGFEDWTDADGKTFTGFKRFVMEGFSPADVEKRVGVAADTMVSLARNFAAAGKPLALCGRGNGQTPGSLHEFMAVHALNALMGRINREGGVWTIDAPDYIKWTDAGLDDVAKNGLAQPRIDGVGGDRYPMTESAPERLADALIDGAAGLQALLVAEANPLYTLRDSNKVKKAFDKIPFIVSFSSYMDETAAFADLILPNHAYLERYQDVPAPFGLEKPVIGMARPVVKPECDTLHVGDSLIQIARAMGGSVADAFGWDSYETCLRETMGEAWDKLEADGYLIRPDYQPPAWDKAFAGPSGKFAFFNSGYQHGEDRDMMSQLKIAGDPSQFPLVLVPYDSMRLAGGPIADTPFMAKAIGEDTLIKNDVYAEVNTDTARELGLAHGKKATLETPVGKAMVRIWCSEGIGKNQVAIPNGLGRWANSGYIAGKGVSANRLMAPVSDPISGMDAAWGVRARLSRA